MRIQSRIEIGPDFLVAIACDMAGYDNEDLPEGTAGDKLCWLLGHARAQQATNGIHGLILALRYWEPKYRPVYTVPAGSGPIVLSTFGTGGGGGSSGGGSSGGESGHCGSPAGAGAAGSAPTIIVPAAPDYHYVLGRPALICATTDGKGHYIYSLNKKGRREYLNCHGKWSIHTTAYATREVAENHILDCKDTL